MPTSYPRPPAAFPRRRRPLALLAALALVSLWSGALAYDGLTVGLMAGPPTGGPYVLNTHAVQPVVDAELSGTPLQFSARADLSTSLAFRSLPAVGLAAVTSSVAEGIERYLGLGAGVSFPGAALGGPLVSVYGLAGFRVPLSPGLYGGLEVQLASNRLITAPSVGLALEYSFGGK